MDPTLAVLLLIAVAAAFTSCRVAYRRWAMARAFRRVQAAVRQQREALDLLRDAADMAAHAYIRQQAMIEQQMRLLRAQERQT